MLPPSEWPTRMIFFSGKEFLRSNGAVRSAHNGVSSFYHEVTKVAKILRDLVAHIQFRLNQSICTVMSGNFAIVELNPMLRAEKQRQDRPVLLMEQQ